MLLLTAITLHSIAVVLTSDKRISRYKEKYFHTEAQKSQRSQRKMITRMPSHCGDETCPSAIISGDYIFLAHHATGHEKNDVVYQMELTLNGLEDTLKKCNATLGDVVQINLLLKDIKDFRKARDVFPKFFKNGYPVRTAMTTDFVSPGCLCMVDAVAYKPKIKK